MTEKHAALTVSEWLWLLLFCLRGLRGPRPQ
jgi:hypothetical protein